MDEQGNKADEWPRSNRAGEVKRWKAEIISQGKETCRNEGVGF